MAGQQGGSPTGSRQSSFSGSGSGRGSGGSASGSPERSGSPNTPGQPGLLDGPAHRSLEAPPAGVPSDAAAAMALLTQQQQAQAVAQVQAQAAAALARLSMDGRGSMDAAAAARASMDAAAAARASMDAAAAARASMDAAAAAATTQAMLQHAGSGGLPPRMSLDSLLASRQAAPGGWVPGAMPPPGATAAAALAAGPPASVPLNEQPFPSGNAPRMSNAGALPLRLLCGGRGRRECMSRHGWLAGCCTASYSSSVAPSAHFHPAHLSQALLQCSLLAAVARKLGLAPQRTSLDARLSKLARGPGMATPPRTSIDGILAALQLQQQQQQQQGGSNRSSLDQQAAMLQAMGNNPQLAHMAGLNGLQPGLNSYGGASAPAYPPANGYGGGPPGGEGMGLHPALLSLVAAQMQGGGPAPPTGVPAGGMHSGLGSQHGSDANMAVLVDSLNSWQLGGPGGAGPASLGHRGSMDGMTGMAGAPVSSRCCAGWCGVHCARAGWLAGWGLPLCTQGRGARAAVVLPILLTPHTHLGACPPHPFPLQGMPAAQSAGGPGGPAYYDGKVRANAVLCAQDGGLLLSVHACRRGLDAAQRWRPLLPNHLLPWPTALTGCPLPLAAPPTGHLGQRLQRGPEQRLWLRQLMPRQAQLRA